MLPPKKEIEGPGGFTMDFSRWPPDGRRKGGIILHVQSSELETFFSEGRNTRDAENPLDISEYFVEAPMLYRPTNGYSEFSHGMPRVFRDPTSVAWTIDWNINRYLVNRSAMTVNAAILRAVGLSTGVQFKIEVPAKIDDIKGVFFPVIDAVVKHIHDQYFKKYRIHLQVPATPPAA